MGSRGTVRRAGHQRVTVDALTCSRRLRDPIVTVARPASVQAKGEPAASVPATIQMPQAVIPTEIRYATAVSITASMNPRR